MTVNYVNYDLLCKSKTSLRKERLLRFQLNSTKTSNGSRKNLETMSGMILTKAAKL